MNTNCQRSSYGSKSYRSNINRIALLVAAFVGVAANASAQGVGDLLIAPTRVVFEGQKRTAEINLTNLGRTPATYRISLIHQRMAENGKLVDVDTPGADDKFADELVRFTPKQVILQPNVAQVVRIQLRLPAELDTGEYRSHMLFRAVPVPGAPTDPLASGKPAGLSINITPIYGISIPVVVRHGLVSARATLANLQLATGPDGRKYVTGVLNREGNGSVYGDLVVEYDPSGAAPRNVGISGGVAVYTPNPVRSIVVPLNVPVGTSFTGGRLRVSYRHPAADGNGIIASGTITLP